MQVTDFSWPQGDAAIGPSLRPIGEAADGTGFDTIWVMDHVSLLERLDHLVPHWSSRSRIYDHTFSTHEQIPGIGLIRASKFVYTEHHTSVD